MSVSETRDNFHRLSQGRQMDPENFKQTKQFLSFTGHLTYLSFLNQKFSTVLKRTEFSSSKIIIKRKLISCMFSNSLKVHGVPTFLLLSSRLVHIPG